MIFFSDTRVGKCSVSTVSITFRAVRACQNPTVCPVKKLFLYVLLAEAMRASHCEMVICFVHPAVKVILSTTPSKVLLWGIAFADTSTLSILSDGEMMHSFRCGCSITLSLLGASDTEVEQHVAWKSVSTAQYYTRGGSLSFFFVHYIHINVCDLKNSSWNIVNCAIKSSKVNAFKTLAHCPFAMKFPNPLKFDVLEHFEWEFCTESLVAVFKCFRTHLKIRGANKKNRI